jgi:GNAT superfamily N-acetyltransferase
VTWRRDGYEISTDPARLDREAIWRFLRTAPWSPGVARDVVERAIGNSIPFGLFAPDESQAGFARVVTDTAGFGWLDDVFVLEAHRGRSLGVWLVQTVLSHPELDGLRVLLDTDDAQGLYSRFGFRPVDATQVMERPAAQP